MALGTPLVGAGLGALFGFVRHSVDKRGVALVLDKVGKTEERLITALHWAERGDTRAQELVDEVSIDALTRRLPVRWPRNARLTPAFLALAVAAAFLPATVWPGFTTSTQRSALTDAGSRLEERLAEIEPPPDAPAWPEAIDRKVSELADAMKGETITEAQAASELDELARQIEALEGSMSDADDTLDALEEAAKALDVPGAEALQEALQDATPEALQDAARELAEALGADPAAREKTADAMRQAGEQLSGSNDPGVAGAGEALKQASEAAANGELSPAQAEQLAEQLQQAREAGRRMAEDREALERAQRLAGAIEGARQQLGEGDPAGQSSQGEGQGGDGTEGEGEGATEGSGENGGPGGGQSQGRGKGGPNAGQGHTWEDQGEHEGSNQAAGNGDERQSDRKDGQHIDDFEKFYEAVRLKGAKPLVAGTNSVLDESGKVDELEYRLTTAEESATVGRVDLPDAYREAASAAIEAEPIPPAYKNAVRDYFAEMD